MPTYMLGYNTKLVDDTAVHLSNFDPSVSVSGTFRIYDKACKRLAEFELKIDPLCTEIISCAGLAVNTYGWIAIETDRPLLVQVFYSTKRNGVVAANRVEETKQISSEPGTEEPYSYYLPYNSQYPQRFVDTRLYISNPNPDPARIRGGFFDQACKMAEEIALKIEPFCTRILKGPQGAYGWAWLKTERQIIINVLFTITDEQPSPRVVASELVVQPHDRIIPEPPPKPGLAGRIAFETFHPFPDCAHAGIGVMNIDGSGQDVYVSATCDSDPAWSPDGARIAFSSSDTAGILNIYLMNADGSGRVQSTNTPSYNSHPSWSPDATQIAFDSNRDGQFEIYVMNADGSAQTRLTNNPSRDLDPDWSPDGRHITFTSNRDGQFEIYVMNVDGSGQTRLTNNSSDDIDPAWSPDGARIAFTSNRDYPGQGVAFYSEIYVMNADGSGQTRLTNNPSGDFHPDWSPDGKQIVFGSMRDGTSGPSSWAEGKWEIYVMNADGSGQTRLTNNYTNEAHPAWRP